MSQRYDIRKEPGGWFSVIDGVEQTGLDAQDADDVAESLDAIDRLTAGLGTDAVN